uniref:RNase H type-1 domain-containing protein n=1 Tax=Oryza meridionalis TaxID=40149 RepID=A0A0E0CQD8_9ORYZ
MQQHQVNDDMYLSANTRLGLEPFNFAFDAAELLACVHGVRASASLGIGKLILESDATMVSYKPREGNRVAHRLACFYVILYYRLGC